MREIKFRAWAKLKDGKGYMTPEFGLGGIPLIADSNGLADLIPIQFTGLLDSKGKEIYEGDILQVVALKMKVVWLINKGCWYLEEVGGGHFSESVTRKKIGGYEVIGNIYESPDLSSPSSEEKK